MSYEMNQMPVSLSEISSYLKEFPMSVEGNYTLAIAIDPSYVASDNLQMYKRQYEEIQPISRMSVYGVSPLWSPGLPPPESPGNAYWSYWG